MAMMKKHSGMDEQVEFDILSDIDDKSICDFVIQSLKLETRSPYSALIKAALHEELAEKEAKSLWKKIVKHREKLESSLKRGVSIKSALVDYFSTSSGSDEVIVFLKSNLVKAFDSAMRDWLTGLYSHAILYQELERDFRLAKRYNFNLTVMLVDVDDYKRYQGEFGSVATDRLLIVISDLLQKRLRRTDKIGRYGEDEFLIVLAHVPFENVHALSGKLLKRIEEATAKDGRLPRGATVSAGISSMTDRMKDCHDLIKAAGRALDEAKQAGKNRVSIAREEP